MAVLRPHLALSFVAALLLGLVPTTTSADYSPPPLEELVLGADVIVVASVVTTGSPMSVRVHDWVVGSGGATIRVAPFEDWTCSARWMPYAVGQKALMFLKVGEDGVHTIMSAGGEGEMPVVGDRVFVHSYYSAGFGLPGGAAVEVAPGVNYSGEPVELSEVVRALRHVRSCFRVTRRDRWRVRGVEHTCGGASIGTDWSGAVLSTLRRAMGTTP